MGKKKIVVAVSGGFDPVHVGHTRLFAEARALGDELVVILNNDNWIRLKKKKKAFMPDAERKEVLEALRSVDRVMLSLHSEDTDDLSICKELAELDPDIFANGGDRTKGNIPELDVCAEFDIEPVFSIGRGGKVQSSSWLIEKAKDASL